MKNQKYGGGVICALSTKHGRVPNICVASIWIISCTDINKVSYVWSQLFQINLYMTRSLGYKVEEYSYDYL